MGQIGNILVVGLLTVASGLLDARGFVYAARAWPAGHLDVKMALASLAAFAGGYQAIRDGGIEALTTGIHLEYEQAAAFDDVLTIGVRCAEIRGARFRYEYVVERDGESVAHGWTMHATVDAATHRPTRVPEWFVEDVLRAEASTQTR